jgi:phage FluMu gp28-like protein
VKNDISTSLNDRIKTYFLPYQQAWLADDARIKLWEKSRRIGATFTQAYEDVRDIVTKKEYTPGRPVTRVYFSSKDTEAGKEYIEYCERYAKVFNIVAKDAGVQVIDENGGVRARVLDFANGGKIFALTSAPTAFNSKGGKIVWDEAALHKDQRAMWSGAHPAANVWGYPVRILSTHKGKSTLFYKFCENTRKGKNSWSLHRVTIRDAVEQGLLSKALGKPTTPEEQETWLEDLRRDCQDDDIFAQDYMAEPIDGSTAFIPYEMIDAVQSDSALVLRGFDGLAAAGDALYAGWDIGRHRDLSVIAVLEDVNGFLCLRVLQEFSKTPFRVQREWLDKVMRLPGLRRICIDKTGMGIPLCEETEEQYGRYRVEGVTFTAAVKEVLAVELRNIIEDRRIIIPDSDRLKDSIHSIKRTVTAAGNIRFDAERTDQTGHADHFWALALALHAKTGGQSGPAWAASRGIVTAGSIGPLVDKFADRIPMGCF